MTRLRALAVIAIGGALLFASPSTAHPAPQLRLERCASLDRDELGEAIERELADSPSTAAAKDLLISANCDGAVNATVRITEKGRQREAQRVIALGEVPAELRPRLLALVAVELAESLLATPEPIAAAAPPIADKAVPAPTRIASRSSLEAPPFALSIGLGARIYTDAPDPLLQLSVELDTAWLTVGAVGAYGSSLAPNDRLTFGDPASGRFYMYLAGLSLRRQLFCGLAGPNKLCVQFHAEGGLSGIRTSGLDHLFESYSGRTTYWMGAVVLEARRPMEAFESSLRFELGVSEGAVIDDDGDTIFASFDGVVAMFNFGFRWMP
jgi:hypothetical protein